MKIKYFLFSLFFSFLFLELTSLIYFKVSGEENKLDLYKNKKDGSLRYKYFNSVGLVLPLPNTKVYHYTSEFTDVFETKDILKNGIGFFDDGIDSRDKTFLAIGDSFTRGVGSGNNLKNGWVELSENNLKDIDIINLGNLGQGINQQKYGYENIKKIFDYDGVIYNFFSGGDYRDNLDDTSYNYYLKRNFENLDEESIQKIVDNFQSNHGYKYHMEYLSKNNFRPYSMYLILKFYDLLVSNGVFSGHKHIGHELPVNEVRLNFVSNELFLLKNKTEISKICLEQYCLINNKIFEDKSNKNKIIANSIEKINNFYLDILNNDKKDFLLIIHPSSRNFFTKETNINYNYLDEELMKGLNKNIKVLYLKKTLDAFMDNNSQIKIFHKHDGHYTPEGYRIVSEHITKFLSLNLN